MTDFIPDSCAMTVYDWPWLYLTIFTNQSWTAGNNTCQNTEYRWWIIWTMCLCPISPYLAEYTIINEGAGAAGNFDKLLPCVRCPNLEHNTCCYDVCFDFCHMLRREMNKWRMEKKENTANMSTVWLSVYAFAANTQLTTCTLQYTFCSTHLLF